MLSFSFSRRLAPRHTQVCDATRSRLCFLAALQERSAAYLRSARYPLPFALSRRQLRGIAQVRMLPAPSLLSRGTFEASAAYSGLHATQLRLCFLAAFRSLRDITQVWMLPACLCSLAALSSAAYLRCARYPLLSLFSRGFSKASTTSSGLDVTRLPLLSRGAWLRGVLWSARYPLPSFSRGVSSTASSGLNATRFLLVHAACSSAASSGLHATRVDSAFSRPLRQLPRHRSGLDATLSRRCFLAAVRNTPRHLSG